MPLSRDLRLRGGNHGSPCGMAVAVLIGQDPAVDQAWHRCTAEQPVDRMGPVPQDMEGLCARTDRHDIEVPGPKFLCEPLQKQRVGIDDEDAFLTGCIHSNLLMPIHRFGESRATSIETFNTSNISISGARFPLYLHLCRQS